MKKRGRPPKLLELEICEIRSAIRQRRKLLDYINQNISNRALAKKFNVGIQCIEKVGAYETWLELP